jgi:hypothetical protein
MIRITINEALEIQESQVKWYGHRYPGGVDALRKVMASKTKIPEGVHRDTPISIFEINRMIPRGGSIENVLHGRDYGGN